MTAVSRGRWLAKKLARGGLAATATIARALPRADRGPSARVLTYHRFADLPRDPFAVDPRVFERQVAHVAREGLAVSLAELEAFVAGRAPLRDGSVLLSIDDGYASVHAQARPILARHGVPAVAFVTVGALGGHEAGAPERHMTFAELRELEASGVAVASHGLSHRSLARLPLDVARAEARRSREILEHELGHAVTAFAYPYGTRADYGAATRAMLAEVGYRLVFTSTHGPVRAGHDPLELSRVKVEGGDPEWVFPRLCRGALDGWRLVDRTLSALQRPAR